MLIPLRRDRSRTVLSVFLAAFVALSGWAGAQDVKPPAQEPKDTDDLADRLIRRTAEGTDEDVMDLILRLMNESGRQLDIKFDPGMATQAVQSRILEKLDDAIKTAAMKRRSRSKSQPQPRTDKRRSKPDKSNESSAEQSGKQQSGGAAEGGEDGVAPMDANSAKGALRERRRGWGRLPDRDREEIIQGADESMLERYKAWIDRYYKALQHDEEID